MPPLRLTQWVISLGAGLLAWNASACAAVPTATPGPAAERSASVELGPSAPEATATAVILTRTPIPTASPAPMATPGAAITLAPAATPDPEEGVGAELYVDPLDGSVSRAWEMQTESVAFKLGGGQLNAVMGQPNVGARISVRPDLSGGDQQTRVTVRVNLCYSLDEYGLVFRGRRDSLNNDYYYVFKVSCEGRARLELVKNFETSVVVDWTPSAAIAAGAPAENTLLVWAAGAQYRFYINEHFVFAAQDDTLAQGYWGFYLRDRTQGGLSVSFLNLIARAVQLTP